MLQDNDTYASESSTYEVKYNLIEEQGQNEQPQTKPFADLIKH
jgi:hypothetical protein